MPNPQNIEKQKGRGRPKGAQSKITRDVKEMILAALDGAGGAEYLQQQALANPSAFMQLIGKVLPMTIKGPGNEGEHKITISWGMPDNKTGE